MKQIKTIFIAAFLILGVCNITNAQSKIAHIASQELVNVMPQYTSAMGELERLQKTYDTEIKSMMSELKKTAERFEAEAKTKTQEENTKRAVEIQNTERTIAEYRNNALKDLQKKEVELLKPVIEKARLAVQKVARAKGFEYVLDSTTGTGMIMADGYDLMADVKKDLGI